MKNVLLGFYHRAGTFPNEKGQQIDFDNIYFCMGSIGELTEDGETQFGVIPNKSELKIRTADFTKICDTPLKDIDPEVLRNFGYQVEATYTMNMWGKPMLHKVSIVPAKPDEEDKAGSEVAAMFNGIQPGNVEGGEKDMPF